ncbi:PTS mannose transporter subunit IID [Anopheles sinensis]|uniref:PTS mannose transporter subunit IID n=1 Tax=Anopheles sinensis TaxID=74873 RepID=A0A084WSV6_ANOSI|nr:PTS mannose transporter subunit IID [Anopheles sinensis]
MLRNSRDLATLRIRRRISLRHEQGKHKYFGCMFTRPESLRPAGPSRRRRSTERHTIQLSTKSSRLSPPVARLVMSLLEKNQANNSPIKPPCGSYDRFPRKAPQRNVGTQSNHDHGESRSLHAGTFSQRAVLALAGPPPSLAGRDRDRGLID